MELKDYNWPDLKVTSWPFDEVFKGEIQQKDR